MNIQSYLDYINAPWGKLFYLLVWRNLNFHNKRILDFGSGFGITANHLAENNDVIALEPNSEMVSCRVCDNDYIQFSGGIELLQKFEDCAFDVIICHNVLEYIDDRNKLIGEFRRLLKNDGVLSIVKHNKDGKIMHKAVFDCNIDEALNIISGKETISVNFGVVKEYTTDELMSFSKDSFEIDSIYGIRTFYGLQNNSYKTNDKWIKSMYELESTVESKPQFRNIAFFHHIIMHKVK